MGVRVALFLVSSQHQMMFVLHTLSWTVWVQLDLSQVVQQELTMMLLNMRPLMSETYSGAQVVERPISDALPPLTLAIGYSKSRPRRLVLDFAQACCEYFACPNTQHCILND